MAQTASLQVTAPCWGSRATSGTKGRGESGELTGLLRHTGQNSGHGDEEACRGAVSRTGSELEPDAHQPCMQNHPWLPGHSARKPGSSPAPGPSSIPAPPPAETPALPCTGQGHPTRALILSKEKDQSLRGADALTASRRLLKRHLSGRPAVAMMLPG